MNIADLHIIELGWIRELQSVFRSTWMDSLFRSWAFVDSMGFVLIVVLIVWYLINKRIGIRLLYIFALSGVINKVLKGYFGLPRPCQIETTIGLICPFSPGFPSGAAQSAILYAGILFFECKQWRYRILGILFSLILCFSRIYLGVHFFMDIIGGLAFGGALLFVYKYLFPIFEKDWKKYAFLFPFLLVAIGQAWAVFYFALFMGVFIGLLSAERLEIGKKGGWLQALCVLAGGFSCIKGASIYPEYRLLFSLIAGVWISFLGARIARVFRWGK